MPGTYHNGLRSIFAAVVVAMLALVAVSPVSVSAYAIPSYDFATPVFGLDVAPDGSLLVADGGAGIVELRKGAGSLVAELPGVSDVASIGRGSMFAITGEGGPMGNKLFRVSQGGVKEIADLLAFEETVDPDGIEIHSNPFDVAVLNGGTALVADAGGNDLLIVDQQGNVDWIATLPQQVISSAHLKSLIGCPDAPEDLAFACFLPEEMLAQPVATSVAVGPDGAYYVGELTGFPFAVGMSRVWRFEPGTLHAECGTSPACSVVLDGFSSVIDLAFGPDGTLYVVEIDEASALAVELAFFGLNVLQGGTVNACDVSSGACSVHAGGLTIPLAAAVDQNNTVYAAVGALIPGMAQVVELP